MAYPIHPAQGPLHAKLVMPGSKSITNRTLLLAALADGVSELSSIYINNEVKTLINALNQLGVVIQLDEKSLSCIVAGCNGNFPKKQASVWYGHYPLIAHFLLAACSSMTGVYFFDGHAEISKRSMAQLINILKRQGAQFIPSDKAALPITLVGADSLEGGEMLLDQPISSLLLSAMLIMSPYARSAFNYTVSTSLPEFDINITCAMMAEFGVLVHRVHQCQFMIPVPQRYQARDYTIETDLSLATYFFAAAVLLQGEVTIEAIKRVHTKQSQRKLLQLLKKIGCHVTESLSTITVRAPTELQGINCQIRHVNELFLAVCIMAPFLKTPTQITHISPLTKIETNRLALLIENLKYLNVRLEIGKDSLKIFPSKIIGATLNAHDDSKLAMALTILGFKIPGIIIDGAECIDEEYPEFNLLCKMLLNKISACA